MLSRNGLKVLLGVLYVLGLNLGWVVSDALNQVVLSTAFLPLFLLLLSAWSETLWLATTCCWTQRGLDGLLTRSFPMAVLWAGSSLLNLMSLHYTALSSNEAITTLMAPTSLLLSLIFIPQQRHSAFLKVCTVLLSISGVFLIILADLQTGEGLGDGFAVVSACSYAAYDVYLKKYMEEGADLRPYLGVMGVIVLIFGFPTLLLVSNLEPLGSIRLFDALLMLLAALFGYFLADFCMAKAVLHLNPLSATLGSSLNVPISVCIDYFAHKRSFSAQFAGGTALCLLAFGLAAALELEIVRKLGEKCCWRRKSLGKLRKSMWGETVLPETPTLED